ncbi:MAG: DUF1015 domain-containing protein [Lachnospiraceae bacterium]|nr:DUF1015 domain-containing protein [Lachnospiraceae bacterium]
MATIKPFKGIRPKTELASQVAALPYDVYNSAEARAAVAKNPLSFLNIDRAETQFPDGTSPYLPEVYEKARDLFWSQVKDGLYIQDEKPCYYVYELIMDGRSQVGLVACASIDDYQNEIIKKHENTRAEKEIDRIKHVGVMEAQTGPIFLAYRFNETIDKEIQKARANAPLYDFTCDDGVTHRAWLIDNETSVNIIRKAFEGMKDIYIADGHHRCASAVKVGLRLREENPGYTGEEEFNFFLSVLFPDEQLMIMDYNRVVKDLNGLSEEEFLQKVEKIYTVKELGSEYVKPSKKGEVAMLLSDTWYLLTVRPEYTSVDPIQGLDVSILQNNVLSPVLGITDPKTDDRIDFVGGIRGYEELKKRVHTDCKAAFGMYPTSIHELFDVADAHLLMPPKSTWFEPKLRSGLFIHSIKKEN